MSNQGMKISENLCFIGDTTVGEQLNWKGGVLSTYIITFQRFCEKTLEGPKLEGS